ncbi:vWA domain-containing protein [Aurantibacillus circumpalustris]|uniref:vWA domain-containing protein n=1 Tax=Aurantibacillus circumpalustris TaxID=3036359 RepID=UPI00295A7027|nr:VWA domain-containing protein [Aurantibacillus circumpalustris]
MFSNYLKKEKSKLKIILLFSIFHFTSSILHSQVTNRILFIFDDSYSMYAPWNSNIKIEVAKKVLADFLDSLKNEPNLELALRCYGHTTFFKPERNCKDSKLEVAFAPAKTNSPKIKQRIQRLEPLGTTPIAYSLGECVNDFTPCSNCRNIVILITDGIEECGGNPCQVSIDLQKKGIFIRPFVIGVGLDVKFADVFGCMGKFYDVSNEANFKDVLKLVITEALSQTTVEVDLLDILKKPTETDVDMTFYEAGTNSVKYNYLHTINNRGNPDTLVLDPDILYDITVHTIPPQEKKNITIVKGKHNVIPIDAPQGFLRLELDGAINKYFPTTIVRKGAEMKTLNVQDFGKTEKYIVGKYDLEVLTLPRIYIKDVEIKQSSTNSIKIPTSGSVLFNKIQTGFGSIYVDDGKTVNWVCNFNPALTNEIIYLQPGKYKAVYRLEFAKETLKTVEKNFEVKSGTPATINLY